MDKNITTISIDEKQIYLIGTAHVSKISAEMVKEAINEIQPDCICIELDEKRYESLKNPKQWDQTNIVDVIKKKQVPMLLINIVLSSYQKRVAKNLDTNSGQEMLIGIQESKELNVPLVLADRSVQTTFMRIWRKLSFFQKGKMLVSLIGSIFESEDITEEDLAMLQQQSMLDNAIAEIAKDFPVIKEVMIDERDQYLAEKIRNAKGNKIVAILGAAHLKGVKKELYIKHNLKELDEIPPKKLASKLVGWIIPIIIITLIILSFLSNPAIGFDQILVWVLWNGTLSALGVLIAGGHILSILTAFLAAPITSLNPLLAAGWFAGIVELSVRKPTVKDFNDLSSDISSFKKARSNRVISALLIVIFANVFSTIGTLIGGLEIVKNFFNL